MRLPSVLLRIVLSLGFLFAMAANGQPTERERACPGLTQLPRPTDNHHEMIVPLAWQKKPREWIRDRNRNSVEDVIERERLRTRIDVLVCLNHITRKTDLDWLATKGTVGVIGQFIPVVELKKVRVADAIALGRDERVAHVELDHRFFPTTDISIQDIRVQSSSFYGAATFEGACPGINGSGVNIAVIDSGVDDPGGPGITHTSLPAAAFGFDVTTSTASNPNDTIGHGTHVAAIALGRPVGSFRGVATGAGLVDIKVFEPGFPTNGGTIMAAVDKIIAQRVPWNIGVANLSLGDCTNSDGIDAVSQNVNAAVSAGIVVSVSMGNANTIPCPLPAGFTIVQSPAASDEAITVQASSYQGTVNRADDAIATNFFLRGPRASDADLDTADELKPDITAPGTNTNGTGIRGINSARAETTASYIRKEGTSMSAPHVAGFAALLLQAKPQLIGNPLTTKQIILTTAEHHGTGSGWQTDWGIGLLDGFAACQAASAPAVTDLQFTANCGSTSPLSWLSPDLVPGNPLISESTPNSILATVTNAGPNNAGPFQVELGLHDFSNSNGSYAVVCTKSVGGLAAGLSTTVTCPWQPNVSATTGSAHACLKAHIIYPADSNGSNDCAQHNVQIQATHSPARFQFALVNPTAEPLRVQFQTDLNRCNAAGWSVRLPENGLTLEPGAPPRMVDVFVDPGEVTAGAKVVNVGVIGVGRDEKRWDLGGVGLVAQLPKIADCNRNKVDDAVDIAIGAAQDRNRNGIPDPCEAKP